MQYDKYYSYIDCTAHRVKGHNINGYYKITGFHFPQITYKQMSWSDIDPESFTQTKQIRTKHCRQDNE